jgi:molybdopterin molybdotransferase
VLSTGAELVPPEEPEPGPARIRDANSTALVWACRAAGADVESLGIAPDEPGPLRGLLARGLEADVLVTSGGVSVGERDLVREGLEALGVEPLFWRVDLRPGKPATAGVGPGGLALGLPGNPASALVGFELFVRPALRAGGAWPAAERRAHAIRVRRAPDGRVAPTGDQGSHRILSLVGAEALALIEPGRGVRAGDAVTVLPAATA